MFRPSCDSIIFDLDGTLWNASPTSALAWSQVAAEHSIDVILDEQAIKRVSGLPFDDCVDALFGAHARKISNLRKLLDGAEQKEIIDRGGKFYSGMQDAIMHLRQRYRLFLVSNCQEWYLNSFFQHSNLRESFQDWLCYGQSGRSKTDNIKEIVKRNSLQKPIYVGDTHWDQEAAFYSGAKFIFVKFGFGSVNVSCPSVETFEELVELMTSHKPAPQVETRRLQPREFGLARKFYESVGYIQSINSTDRFYGAFHEDRFVGLVRLVFEEGNWVLRGMQIQPNYQFFGIGTKLIRLLDSDLGGQECFCLPHGWLAGFYGQIGFKPVTSPSDAPKFLAERFSLNQKKYPKLILMKRPRQ